MKEKTQSVKKKAAAPAAKAKRAPEAKAGAKGAKGAKAPQGAQGGWAETMKKALQNKRPAGGFPDQPKPRDSGVQKVKKNAF